MKIGMETKFKETEIGLIPEEWGLDVIGNIASVTDYVANGSFADLKKHVKYSHEKDYAIVVRLSDFNRNYSGDFIYVNKEGFDFLKKSRIVNGDVIIANIGEYAGTVFRAPKINYPMTLGPNAIVVKTKTSDDFYYYWLKSEFGQSSIGNIRSGSAVPKFNKTDFRNLVVPIPPLVEQQRIVEILSSLDDKIELNRKINDNLEKIASAIFKEWFVDIGDKLPEGWRMGTIGNFAKIKSGFAFKGSDFCDQGVPVIKIKNIVEPNVDLDNVDFVSESAIKGGINNFILETGDILIAMSGNTTGKIGIMPKINDKYVLNQRVGKYNLKNKDDAGYLYFFLKSGGIQEDIIHSAYGSAQPNISPSILEEFKILIPNRDILEEFNVLANGFLQSIANNNFEIRILSNLRNFLLPRLMSGKIRV